MKKTVLFICLAVLMFAGCPNPPQPPETLPSDFSVEYESGAMHLEWGHYELSIDSKGNGVFKKSMGMNLTKEHEFKVSEQERKKIYDAVIVNSFFGLNNNYDDPSIMDGGFSKISITAEGENKTVNVVNTNVDAFDKVKTEIINVLKKHVENPFSFDDLKEDCSKKKAECMEENSFECEEWQEFCEWDSEFNSEYCEKIQNRNACIEYCSENFCEKELCETLMFEPKECSKCSPGCCSYCDKLDSCETINGCRIVWIHPEGESWQFQACENTDLCTGIQELCDYVFVSYQGYRYHSLTEENQTKAKEYESTANKLQELHNQECG